MSLSKGRDNCFVSNVGQGELYEVSFSVQTLKPCSRSISAISLTYGIDNIPDSETSSIVIVLSGHI